MELEDTKSRKRIRLDNDMKSETSSPPIQPQEEHQHVHDKTYLPTTIQPPLTQPARAIETIDMTGRPSLSGSTDFGVLSTPAQIAEHFSRLKCAGCGKRLMNDNSAAAMINKQCTHQIGASQRKPTTIAALEDASTSPDPSIPVGIRLCCSKCFNISTCFGCGQQANQTSYGAEGDGISLAWHCDHARLMLIWFFLFGYDGAAKHENPKAREKETTPSKKDAQTHARGRGRGRGTSSYGRGGRGGRGGKHALRGIPKGIGYGGSGEDPDYDEYEAAFDSCPSDSEDFESMAAKAAELEASLAKEDEELFTAALATESASMQEDIAKLNQAGFPPPKTFHDFMTSKSNPFSGSGHVLGSNTSNAPPLPSPSGHSMTPIMPPTMPPLHNPISYTNPQYQVPPGASPAQHPTPHANLQPSVHSTLPKGWLSSPSAHWEAYSDMNPPSVRTQPASNPSPAPPQDPVKAKLDKHLKQLSESWNLEHEDDMMAQIIAEDEATVKEMDASFFAHAPYFRHRRHRNAAPIFEDPDDALTSQILAILVLLLPNTNNSEPTAFDFEPPTGLISILCQSSMMDRVGELLRNDSVEDAARRGGLYEIVLRFVTIISSHCSLQKPLFISQRVKRLGNLTSPATKTGTDTSPSLFSCMDGLITQARMITRQAERDHQDFATDEGQRLLWISNSICELADSLIPLATLSGKVTTATSEAGGTAWSTELAMLEIADETILASHTYGKAAKELSDAAPGRIRQLLKEITRLKTGLPPGIYLRYGESRMDVLKVLITGPEGTPYENGLWEFDIFLGAAYPNEPPKVYFRTTGGGTARVNPNLYDDGKVCLSLLGTWSGEPWRPGQSTLLQVLVSIQAMIFCDEPHCNEPSFEQERGSERSRDYNRRVYGMTVKHAMLEWLSPGIKFEGSWQHGRVLGGPGGRRCGSENVAASDGIWKDVVKKHFETHKGKILQTVAKWCADKPPPRRQSTRHRGRGGHAPVYVHGPGHVLGSALSPVNQANGSIMPHSPSPPLFPPPPSTWTPPGTYGHHHHHLPGPYPGSISQPPTLPSQAAPQAPPSPQFPLDALTGGPHRASQLRARTMSPELKQDPEVDGPVDLFEKLKEAVTVLSKNGGHMMFSDML